MKYFFGFLASVALIILVVILVIRGFSGGGAKPKDSIDLLSYGNTDASMQVTVDGPVNADQEHDAYRITITRDENRIETLSGYEHDVVDTQTYPNNEEAFETFLLAIDRAGYTLRSEKPKIDDRGICPTGKRYVYEIKGEDGTSSIMRSWSGSCMKGTFRGKNSSVMSLFRKQIPDFGKVTSKLDV